MIKRGKSVGGWMMLSFVLLIWILAACVSDNGDHGSEIRLDPDIQVLLDAFNSSGVVRFETMTPAEVRQAFSPAVDKTSHNPPIERIEDVLIPVPGSGRTIPARLFHPAPGRTLPLVVFYHGGGFLLGSLDSYENECRLIAATGPFAVLSVDYRLAPEHPFPAAVEDSVIAARWALANAGQLGADPLRVAVAGDSAGGTLSAVVSIALRDQPVPGRPLAAQFLVYPGIFMDMKQPSWLRYGQGYMTERVHVSWFLSHYVPDPADRLDPRFAPGLAGDLSGLPATVILLAEVDVLHDEGVAYAGRLQSAGTPVDLRVAPGMIHGFFTSWSASPAAQREVEAAVHRLAGMLGGPRTP